MTRLRGLDAMREYFVWQIEDCERAERELKEESNSVTARLEKASVQIPDLISWKTVNLEQLKEARGLTEHLESIEHDLQTAARLRETYADLLQKFDTQDYQPIIERFQPLLDVSRAATLPMGEQNFSLWGPVLAMKEVLNPTQ